MSFEEYLQTHYRPRSVETYLYQYRLYAEAIGEEKTKSASYRDILSYVGVLRARYDNAVTVRDNLGGVRVWHRYLIESGQRKDDPSRAVRLKDGRKASRHFEQLLSKEELAGLLDVRLKEHGIVRVRNQVLMSLLVHQALRVRELVGLYVEDIDLRAAKVTIRSTEHYTRRRLQLQAEQVLLVHEYITEIRARVARPGVRELLVTKTGEPFVYESVRGVLRRRKKCIEGKRVTAEIVRQSVIRNLLKSGHNVRVVQRFVGHGKPSATESYREQDVQELLHSVDRYHPLT